MKKFLLFSVLLCSLSLGVSAQKLFSFGPKAGVNFSTATGLDGLVDRGKTNVVGGVYAEVRPLKWLGVSVEALYSAEGFVTKDIQIDNQSFNMDMSLGYIIVPIMAKIYVVGGLSLNVGYQPSFLVSSRVVVGGSSDFEVDPHEYTSTIPVGLSYSFDFGLLVDARYNIGLSDINRLVDGPDDALSIQNRTWSLTLGWKF